ncbi:MAG: hypothetical protein WC335_09025 [Candidatus Omnitrophota bacterium]|jgi:hypothetical protein
MVTKSLKKIAVGLLVFSCIQISAVRAEQSIAISEDVRKALDNLKDDNLTMNCAEATKYLYRQKEKIVDILVNALPSLDWQGQDVVLKILTEIKTYTPNESVIRLMLERIKDERSPNIRDSHDIYHYDYIPYIGKYAGNFKPLLKSYIKVDNIRQLWAVTHILAKNKILDEMKASYSPEVMDFVIKNLRDDNIEMNASYSARILFLIGKDSIPFLKKEIEQGDAQSKGIAEVLLGLFSGTRHLDSGDLWEFVDELTPYGVTLGSTYLERIEQEGSSSLIDFWTLSHVSDSPKFLTGGSYSQRED